MSGTLTVSKRSEKSSLNFEDPVLFAFVFQNDVFKVAFKIFVVRNFDKQNLSHQENSQIIIII